ncbi:MAG: macro domain-containing protein [Eubacteriales bacterium]
MVNIKNGDLLKCEEDIICHQVNTFGEMGGGVAYQIKMKYPKANREYEEFCFGKSEEDLIGEVCMVDCGDKIIANLFSQRDFDTDYEALAKCLKFVADNYKGKSLAMPLGIGCGIASGNWDTVYGIIEEAFTDSEATLYKFKP